MLLRLIGGEERECRSWGCAGEVRVEAVFIDIGKVGCKRVEVLLSDWVVLMVVAPRAFEGQT